MSNSALSVFVSCVLFCAGSAEILHGGGECTTDWDCSLGGYCHMVTNTLFECRCDLWFTGANCALLNFGPAEEDYGFQVPGSYSWGGHALYDNDANKYVGFFSFMVDHCSLQDWTTNSEIIMTTSNGPHGPYDAVNYEKVVAPWSHNPFIAQYEDTYMIFHIGNGVNATPKNCTTQKASVEHKTRPQDDTDDHNIYVEVSQGSLQGPWTPFNHNKALTIDATWQTAASNPAPFIFANGTTLLYLSVSDCPTDWGLYNRCIAIARADHWKGPYEMISRVPIVHSESEDPSVFQDPRGNFHLLTNANSGHKRCAESVSCGGHAWSRDGITWSEQFVGAFGPVLHLNNGSTWTNAYIERPQVFQDPRSRQPVTFFAGLGRTSYTDSISWAQPFCTQQLLEQDLCRPSIPL